MLIKTLQQIVEDRDPNLSYEFKEVKGKVDRIIVRLEGKRSEVFTKLAKRYKELDDALAALEKKRNELNAETKDRVLEYFDAEDEVLTRVVESVSMTATMSKLAQPSPKVDYESIVNSLIKLMPELTEKVSELQAQFTTIPKPKSPSLSVKTNESVGEMWDVFRMKIARFVKSVKAWGKRFDEKLEKIKRAIDAEFSALAESASKDEGK